MPISLLDAKKLFYNYLAGTRFQNDYKHEIENSVSDFLLWTVKKKRELNHIKRKDIVNYHKYLCEKKSEKTEKLFAPGTINIKYNAIKQFFSLLYQTGKITENPTHGLKLNISDKNNMKRRALTVNEVNTVLDSLDITSPTGLRDRAMFELIYSSGLRVIEVCNLRMGHIDLDRRIMVVRGKFERDRFVPLSEVARDYLLLYAGKRLNKRDSLLFPGKNNTKPIRSAVISRRFTSILKQCNMKRPEVSTHSLRHSTATHLLDNGASIRHVQELLGHKYIDTTERYTHVQTDGVLNIFRKFHPREQELFRSVNQEYRHRLENLASSRRGEL
jgi:integrase/recombinase XerD